MQEDIFVIGAYFLILGLWVLGIIGWIMNIMTIWNTYDLPLTGKFVLRIIGIFVFPIGGILGYIS
jgi:hypothetical protein